MSKFLITFFLLLELINPLSASARISTASAFGEKIFVNQMNEQVILRGMNVSGQVKLLENNFRPFLNKSDAALSFNLLKNNLGANVVRLNVSWEAIEPTPFAIDLQYIADIALFIEEAAKWNIYILIDFHQDLFSRHIFSEEQVFKGNGAPLWATPDLVDSGKCGVFCFHWAQNNLTNKTVREAYRQFFNNDLIEGEFQGQNLSFKMQDTYINMLSSFLALLKNNLSREIWDKVLGIDPFNEPVDGGMQGLDSREWDIQKLWPFYLKIESQLLKKHLGELLIFAEPLVFWNNNVGFISPRTGTGYFKGKLSKRFVFNSHYYDAKRQGPIVLRSVKSGDYLSEFDAIRNEAKRLNVAAFVSEFGAPLNLKSNRSPVPILRSMYLGLDQRTPRRLESKKSRKKVKIKRPIRANFYSAPLSYTQWQFDIYYNQTPGTFDNWNKENFSVVKNKQGEYNLPKELLERVQILSTPLRIYHSISTTGNLGNYKKNWSGLFNLNSNSIELIGKRFFFCALAGNKNIGEHLIFVPKSFGPYVLITSKQIIKARNFGMINIASNTQGRDDFIFIAQESDLDNFALWQSSFARQLELKLSPIFILPH